MPQIISRLKTRPPRAVDKTVPVTTHVEASSQPPRLPSNQPTEPLLLIGPKSERLKDEMIKLYWTAVEHEIPNLLLALVEWTKLYPVDQHTNVDPSSTLIYGYDTFLDQISSESRDGVRARGIAKGQNAMEDLGRDLLAQKRSSQLRKDVRDSLDGRHMESRQQRRARLLLQSMQWLDIDRVITDTGPQPTDKLPTAQLKITWQDKSFEPLIEEVRCTKCSSVIRGSRYMRLEDCVCERCYYSHHFGDKAFSKRHKESCLPQAITPDVGRKLCYCLTVLRRNEYGKLRALWPMDERDVKAMHVEGGSGIKGCPLVELHSKVDAAKANSTLTRKPEPIKHATSRRRSSIRLSLGGQKKEKSVSIVENIPTPASQRDVYEHLQMGVTLGPLRIENGPVEDGVRISCRRRPWTVDPNQEIQEPTADLVLNEQDANVFSQTSRTQNRRVKAVVKQVVGGAFTGLYGQDAETTLIDALLSECQILEDAGDYNRQYAIEAATSRLLPQIQNYLKPRLIVYISAIVGQLLEPGTRLKWEPRSNNCRMFCDGLLASGHFSALLAPQSTAPASIDPLYLMSFVSKPGPVTRTAPTSKWDVPNSFLDEYLVTLQDGILLESDLIDFLSEYWYDWCAFERPPHKHQDIFPWDCTEAYGRGMVKCGECNVAKHVWASPFDAWSIISQHLGRERCLYPKSPDVGKLLETSLQEKGSTGQMRDDEWFENRLSVLEGHDSLNQVAVALAKNKSVHKATKWLHQPPEATQSEISELNFSHQKLGGANKAQPTTEYFQVRTSTAEWSSYTWDVKKAEYERTRDFRAAQQDVWRYSPNTNGRDGGGRAPFGTARAVPNLGLDLDDAPPPTSWLSSKSNGFIRHPHPVKPKPEPDSDEQNNCGGGCGGCGG